MMARQSTHGPITVYEGTWLRKQLALSSYRDAYETRQRPELGLNCKALRPLPLLEGLASKSVKEKDGKTMIRRMRSDTYDPKGTHAPLMWVKLTALDSSRCPSSSCSVKISRASGKCEYHACAVSCRDRVFKSSIFRVAMLYLPVSAWQSTRTAIHLSG